MIEQYYDAISEFCSDNPGLQIYMAGSISHPGISDLDFLTLDEQPVISDNIKRFLMGGNVIVYPREFFQRINEIEKFDLQLLQGDEIQALPAIDAFDEVEILEWLPERICLLESLDLVTHDTSDERRRTLLYLKSVDRSISNVEKYTNYSISRPSIDDVRLNHEMLNLNETVRLFIFAANEAWSCFEREFRGLVGDICGTVNISSHYTFNDRFKCLMLYLKLLSSVSCELTEKLNERVSLDGSIEYVEPAFLDFVVRRWHLLNDVFLWHRTRGHVSGMIKYGWFLLS